MRNILLGKGLILGIILLFVGASVTQGISIDVKSINNFDKEISSKPYLGGFRYTNKWVNVNPEDGEGIRDRINFLMVYNSSADRTIVYGGESVTLETHCFDTWAYNYNDNTLTNMSPAQDLGQGSFCDRQFCAYTYDSGNDLTLLFGGEDGMFNDTWSYDYADNNWTNLSALPSYSEVGGTLTARGYNQMVYNSSAQRVIMYGGWDGDTEYDETWAYDGSTNTWIKMNPTFVGGNKLPRAFYGMAYDSANDMTLLFGGQVLDGGVRTENDTWSYDYANDVWTNLSSLPSYGEVGGTLSPRYLLAMTYGSNSERVIMTCGTPDGGTRLNDTWVYNSTDNKWYKATPTDIGGDFPEICSHRMVYDSNASKVILFGGLLQTGSINETWVFKHNDVNEPPNPPTNPVPANGSINVDIDADLSWYCWDFDFDDLTYDVYFEANDPTPDVKVSSNQTSMTYDPGTMELETTYYWQIVAWDSEGHSTAGPIWHFTTRGNNPPNTPSDPSPEDGETSVYINTDLSFIYGGIEWLI